MRTPYRPLLAFVRTNNEDPNPNTERETMGLVETLGTFILTCNHTISFRTPWPKHGDYVTCSKGCRNARIVQRIREYKIRCNQCPYGRSFGLDQLAAERRANYHAGASAHSVTVYQGGDVVKVIEPIVNVVIDL